MVISGLTLRVHVLVEDFQSLSMLGCLFVSWENVDHTVVLWQSWLRMLLKSILPVSLLWRSAF